MKHKILFAVLCFLYLSCSGRVSDNDIRSRVEIINGVAKSMNSNFYRLKNEAVSLASKIAKYYETGDSILRTVNRAKYTLARNGVLYKPLNDGGSAVFVSGASQIDEKVKRIVYFTEPMDAELKSIVEEYPEVAQAYYNDEHSYNRIYPFFDVLAQYEPKMRIPDFNFYYLADSVHNPGRNAVWVKEPYVDPAGRGWMISVIAPCYVKQKLVGVPGIDITTNTITDRYLSERQNSNLLLIDSTGVIVTAQENIINLLGFPALKDHKYVETIKLDTYRKDAYNLFLNKEQSTRRLADNIINKKKFFFDEKISGQEYKVVAAYIPEVSWYLIEVISLYEKD